MSFVIRGLGTALPEHSIPQSEAAALATGFIGGEFRRSRALAALFERTRVEKRASVLLEDDGDGGLGQSFYPPAEGPDDRGPGTETRMRRFATDAAPLALTAAQRALDRSGVPPGDVTHLVTVSCTGFDSPGVDIALVKQLGLPPTVGRINVGFMGCHGALNGLRAVQAICESDRSAVVLLCAVELCSLHYQYGRDPQQLVANALFADGAAAVVGQSARADTTQPWRLVSCGSCLIPDAEDAMTWRIGDHGFEMTLSPRVPGLIGQHLRPWMESWLAASDLAIGNVRSWAIHPGGPRILSSAATALDLPAAATAISEQVLSECGNMSSPTVLFILDRLREVDAPRPAVALAFGPGLVAEAALFE
jgi:predicted naringenin-chalcone synthase